jgi:GH24 family phage-related lysozyme (muramidase)
MYQDSNGLITVGVGKMLPDITSALRLHFVQRGTEAMATNTQIKEDYESVQKQPAALRAAQYKPFTKLDLPQKEIKKILKQDIADFKKQLKHQFPGFQSYPLTVQFALVEMAFTLGTKKLIESFPSFCKAVRDADWATAARESHRAGVSEARNLKVKNWLEEAGKAGP